MKIEKDKIKIIPVNFIDLEVICPVCGEENRFYDAKIEKINEIECWACDTELEIYIDEQEDNISEDIKKIEEIKEEYSKISPLEEYARAIENILKENKSLQEAYDNCYCEYKHYKQYESVPINKIKQKMFEYKKMAEELYEEFLRTDKTNSNIRDLGMSCDNRANALEELLKLERAEE